MTDECIIRTCRTTLKKSPKAPKKINKYSAYHQIVTFCDFLGNFQKLSTKNTTKLENSSNSYGFLIFYRNYLVVGTVYSVPFLHHFFTPNVFTPIFLHQFFTPIFFTQIFGEKKQKIWYKKANILV